MTQNQYDYIIIGAGVVGLALAHSLKKTEPDCRILVLDKEGEVAAHSSGRNSGILHAGFYYSADSFKARFTVIGNIAMKEFCRRQGLPVNDCGKLVVAQNEHELALLDELFKRGKANGSNVTLVDEKQAESIEPNVRTHKRALFSPDTASVDPAQVCRKLRDTLVQKGVEVRLSTAYLSHKNGTLETTGGEFSGRKIINAAGLYADKIARDFGCGFRYTMIPFKGLYLKYSRNSTDIRINIYPVPNLLNPFLGVHFTKTVDGHIKIGPTAIPAFWRENYGGMEGFRAGEMGEITRCEAELFFRNAFHFRDLAFEEMRKYYRPYFIRLASRMVKEIDTSAFSEFTAPGIRAQLLDKKTLALVQDFVVETSGTSIHVLNAVSPAFTCAFPFADYIVSQYIHI